MAIKNNLDIKISTALMFLKDHNVHKLYIHYSGGGDDGGIDDVDYRDSYDDPIDIKWNHISKEVIRNAFYEIIDQHVDDVGDWVNNDGGYGNITVYLEDMKYDIEYSQRTTKNYDWHGCRLFKLDSPVYEDKYGSSY